jgi:hypothetical protein
MDLGSPLAHENRPSLHHLAIVSLDSQTLAMGISSIRAATLPFFMSKNLKIKDPH